MSGRLLWWGAGAASVIAAGLAGAYLVTHLLIHLNLDNQDMQVTLPSNIVASLQPTEQLEVQLIGDISTVVPFNENLAVPLKGNYAVDVELKEDIPVAFDVVYEGVIPVDTMASLTAKTEIDFGNVKQLRNLEIQTEVPMQFEMPVKLNVPVRDSIVFDYSGPITVIADEMLTLAVNTEFEPTIYVDQRIRKSVIKPIGVAAELPPESVSATITEATLNVRPTTLRLERR